MKRDNKNGKYYCISNPTEANIRTGNYCVSYRDYVKNDKDYLFDWTDPNTGEHYEKVISKEYLHAYCKPCPKWMYNELSMRNELKGMFYLISFKDIYLYEEA